MTQNTFRFADLLEQYVSRAGYNVSQLARLSDLPHKTVANWLEGRVRKPRTQEDLLKVAKVLRLSASETTSLLQAADYPSVEELWKLAGSEKNDLLSPWADSLHQRSKKAPFQAIADLPYFVGREQELKEIKTAVLTGRYVTVCSLQGMGGVGKTAVAAHLAYQLRPYFPDGVLWARVDTTDAMSILRSFAAAYGRDVSQYTDLEGRSQTVRELLAHKKTLIILDNARNSDEIKPLLPPSGGCAVIITTRYQNLFATSGALRFQLGPFNVEKEESLQLFVRTLGQEWVERERISLQIIAQILGHLPLAIAIAASRLAYEPGWSAENFLKRLHQEKKRLTELTYENQSVRLSANLSYEVLQPHQQVFFASLGAFASENLNIEAIVYVTGLSADEVMDHLRKLYSLSLVQIGQPGRYRLHPLLRDYAREKLEAEAAKERVFERLVSFFVEYAEAHTRDFPLLDIEIDNIMMALEQAFSQNLKKEFVQGTIALCHFLRARGLYALAMTNLERARGTAVFLNDKSPLVIILFHLGSILRRQGQHQLAAPHLQEGLILARQLEDPELISMILGELGVVLCRIGEHVQGAIYFEESLALARQAENVELICTSLVYVGVNASEHGDISQAEIYYQEGLALAQQHGYDEKAVFFLNNLGVLADTQGDKMKGEGYFQKSLELAQKIGLQEIVSVSFNNLGLVAQSRQDMAQAENYYRESLSISQQMGHSSLIFAATQNLAELVVHQKRYEEGMSLYQQLLEKARQNESATIVIVALHGLGGIAIAQNDVLQAKHYFAEAITQVEQARNSERLISAFNDWGELFLQEKMLESATVVFNKTKGMAQSLSNKALVAWSDYGLARVTAVQGDWVAAKRQALESLQVLEQINPQNARMVRQWLVEQQL